MPNFPLRVDGEKVPRIAEGTHDPLFVKSVVLEEGETILSLTSYDLVDAFEPVIAEVRRRVTADLPIAVLVNYTAHPTIMRSKYRLLSAEFPGAMARHVAGRLGDDVPVLFFNGAQGNVAPLYDTADDWERMETMGRQVGDEVLRVYPTIETDAAPGLKIDHRDGPFERSPGTKRVARLHAIFFSDTAIVTEGGELFVEIGLEFKRRCLFPHAMLFGLTDGDLWYIPHGKAYEYGGYGVDRGPTPTPANWAQTPVGLGEEILDAWLDMMYEEAEGPPVTDERRL